jgi:endo-1,4-beta-xylanase
MMKHGVYLATILVLTAGAQSPAGRKYGYGPPDALKWVDPDHSDAGDLKLKTFYSNTIKGDVSYMIYLPPGYEQNRETRYPVLYQLPASGGTPRRDGPQVTLRIDKAIRERRIDPMIVVAVNGLAGNTMYCDTRDGLYPLETVIIKDLIPHIDATYRTIASREGRGVNGFSMGGFGAAHLGFKYPDVFGVDSIMAPPLIEPGLTGLPAQAWSRLFPSAMDSDMDYWKDNNPFELAARNADKLRDRTFIRIVAHSENEHWLAPQCEKLHKILADNMVQHEYCLLLNVKAHNPAWCMDTLGYAALSFFSSSVMRQKPGQQPGATNRGGGTPKPPESAKQPIAPPLAEDGWEQLPDGTLGWETEFHGVDGLPITAYIRKPAGQGPFPAIVWMHGGRDSKQATINMGRSQRLPVEAVVNQGWVIYSADYRHAEKIGIYPIEFDDTVKAVEAARALPFVDPKRIGYMGQSHGAQVGTRVVSRVDLSGAVIMAPAAMDFIEIKKAMKAGVRLVPILSKILADLEEKYGAPMEEIARDPGKYGYSSSITEAAQVRCPILIENARDDDNSPPSVIEAWVKALRAAGKQVATYEPDHGGHGFYFADTPEAKQGARLAVAFFQRVFAGPK